MIEEVLVDEEDYSEIEEVVESTEVDELIDELVKEATDQRFVDESVVKEEFSAQSKQKIRFGDILFNRKAKVFVKVNNDGYITQIDSDVFLKDTKGWTQYDEGEGDKFVYAQTSYFEESIVDDAGNYRYKI